MPRNGTVGQFVINTPVDRLVQLLATCELFVELDTHYREIPGAVPGDEHRLVVGVTVL